MQTYILL